MPPGPFRQNDGRQKIGCLIDGIVDDQIFIGGGGTYLGCRILQPQPDRFLILRTSAAESLF